jgi:hypothetical protein
VPRSDANFGFAALGVFTMRLLRYFATVAAAFGLMAAAHAQELKIGLSAEPSAMDPHFHNLLARAEAQA